MAAAPPVCDFGWKALDFSLKGIDGKTHGLAEVAGPKGIAYLPNSFKSHERKQNAQDEDQERR